MMLACEALALASQSDQQTEIVRLLHEYQDAMEASQENDTEYFGADYRFHKVFFDYCGNRYLMETLSAAPAEKLKLELSSGTAPCLVLPTEGEENFLYMVLPVRLKAGE